MLPALRNFRVSRRGRLSPGISWEAGLGSTEAGTDAGDSWLTALQGALSTGPDHLLTFLTSSELLCT